MAKFWSIKFYNNETRHFVSAKLKSHTSVFCNVTHCTRSRRELAGRPTCNPKYKLMHTLEWQSWETITSRFHAIIIIINVVLWFNGRVNPRQPVPVIYRQPSRPCCRVPTVSLSQATKLQGLLVWNFFSAPDWTLLSPSHSVNNHIRQKQKTQFKTTAKTHNGHRKIS